MNRSPRLAFVFCLGLALALSAACGGSGGAKAPVATATPTKPHLVVSPAVALVDTPVHTRVEGLAPGQSVSLRLSALDDVKVQWQSEAAFKADDHGTVDLDRQSPVSGSYDGVDGMGLFWSMDVPDPARKGGSFAKNGGASTVMTLTAEVDAKRVDGVALQRDYAVAGLKQTPVTEDGLRGVFYAPPGGEKHGAVITLGGSEGGLSTQTLAALLASRGYPTLALAYFNYPGLPADLSNIPLEYFQNGIAWLQQQPGVNPDEIVVLGVSRGGELALLLGSEFPQVKGVVAYVPSDKVNGAYRRDGKSGPAWTFKGAPLAPGTPIEVEKINGPVLVISGGQDGLWPSQAMSEAVDRRLADHNFSSFYKQLNYPDAGHAAGFPYEPTTEAPKTRPHPVSGALITPGGTPKGDAQLQSDSWPQVLALLSEALK